MKNSEMETFDSFQKSTLLELCMLSGLFVVVICSLLYLERLQTESHHEVLGQADPIGVEKTTDEFTRNQSPALGL